MSSAAEYMTLGPDDTTTETHPAYGRQYGHPRDEQLIRAVLQGLAYRMPDDAWERSMERFETKKEAVRKVGRIVHDALKAGMPYAERRALYYRLMREAGEDVCFTCGGPMHGGSCEHPDSGMWERETVDAEHQSGCELTDSDNRGGLLCKECGGLGYVEVENPRTGEERPGRCSECDGEGWAA